MVDKIEHKHSDRDKVDATDALRRRFLKAGAATVPVIVSLQSGTAWAISSCADNVNVASQGTIQAALTDANNQTLITAITGISDTDITAISDDCGPLNDGGTYPDGPGETVEDCEVLHLLVTNGSCWASYCTGPINTAMDVTVDQNPEVCTGGGGGP